jgi:hypothetical protein
MAVQSCSQNLRTVACLLTLAVFVLTGRLTMTYKSDRVRTAALVSYWAAKHSGVSPVQHLQSMPDADAYADVKAPMQCIRDVVAKWQHHGEVVNLFSTRASSHPRIVPDEVICKCATIIKAGYSVELLVASGSGQLQGQGYR